MKRKIDTTKRKNDTMLKNKSIFIINLKSFFTVEKMGQTFWASGKYLSVLAFESFTATD